MNDCETIVIGLMIFGRMSVRGSSWSQNESFDYHIQKKSNKNEF